ncbi:DUF6562 domain-containing protein [Bacteroides uniformis]|jgi:hypothetical protein|uniref:DUF6562 domain-containing protein n=1 Tax=Bacteroides uniformis TaxID=820 RepID=UPI00189B7CC0|nr:DUF6562 domain-containing protein [Bacteroides uniformis]MDC1996405.1 hypothetical protein [Bacteroides uniformis]MDC2000161.1 hypothetical protein [Bacteroides uniformis]MDC2003853.1 hypothetical protein [Bacteroides uniformis]
MKPYQYIRSLILAFAILSFSACSNDDYLQQTMGENVSVTFRPTLKGELNTRAIGDAAGIDRLTIVVYEGTQTLSKKLSYSEDWDIAKRNGITLTLIEGHSYKILFWAENSVNTAYTLTNDGKITVDYNGYIDGGFAKMEEMDAFCGTSSITVGSKKNENKQIELSRPLAQLNFADNTTLPEQGTHQTVVTFHGVPTSFNPFTGIVEMSNTDVVFTFADFPAETLSVDGSSYYYLSSNYFFAPQTGTISNMSATIDLQNTDGISIKEIEVPDITLEKNKKTNILGSIVQQPETWSVWDGEIPKESTLTTDPENQNRYIIDEADDVAWLSVQENAQSLAANSTFIMTVDVDMNNGSGLAAIQLPSGSILDGDGHTIKGLQLENALLGDVTDITVKNLTIEETTVANTSADVTHIGVLVNTLKGSNTFSNIHIKSSSVSTQNGAAGGIVGYISRKDPNNREETLTVTFDDCHVTETTVSGTQSEGHFVGLLRGYDNKETLQFNNNCTLTLSATVRSADEFVSPYREGNEGAWLADNDYSKYNGWLGDEECYRGTVMYGDKRFIPCWDGITKITPLTDGTTKLIYSAFDLASLQGSGHAAVTFKEDVDLGGDRATNKNPFTPISTISTLDGGDKTIYNLYINVTNWIGAFIGASSGTTSHKNLNFSNSSVLVKPSSGSELAYAATLCAYIEGSYTAENIKIDNAYVLGISKSGGLNGYVTSGTTFYTAKQCSVNNLRLENSYLHLTGETFAASGEMGGLVGFIQQSALVESCSVTNSVINCSNSVLRHVNQFIGTIRLDNSSHRIDINKCNVSGNIYENKKDEKSKFVGGYSLSSLLQRGKVYIDGTRLR